MFKSQKSVNITALVLYVAYLFGASYLFGLEYGLWFYAAAVMIALGFWVYTADYYPHTEVWSMEECSSSTARCLKDGHYAWASLAAIGMLLVSITPVLVTVYLNQHEIYHLSWFIQALIFFACYILQFITPSIYKSFQSTAVSGEVWYKGFLSRPNTPALSEEEVNKRIDEACKLTIPKEMYAEARAIVREILIKRYKTDPSWIKDTATWGDLGLDELEVLELVTMDIEEFLEKKYGYGLSAVKHHVRETEALKLFLDKWQPGKGRIDLYNILKGVNALNDLVAGAIYYIKRIL